MTKSIHAAQLNMEIFQRADFAGQSVLAPSGATLNLRGMLSKTSPKGIILFHHGAAEHSARYAKFARMLSDAGFHFFIYDQRGHGHTTIPSTPSHMFGRDGWSKIIDDSLFLQGVLKAEFSDLPLILAGHSMGSIITFDVVLQNPDCANAVMLLGPVLQKNPAMPVLKLLLGVEALMKKPESTSYLFQKLAWDPLNKPFEPARTPYDWLSRDQEEVDAYIADDECGWPPTINFAQEMTKGLAATFHDSRLKALRAEVPILLMSGAQDSSTDFAKSVPQLEARLKAAGVDRVTSVVFDEMRHELHNELGREAVFERLISWCNDSIPGLA